MVAIKLFSSELARGDARNRFVQEARVVGQISHPTVIALHDMGIDEPSQTPYLVMEFIQGQSLEKLLEKGSIPCSKACAWAAEVATALAVAHRKGVIHGDVKPANILITEDDRIKLTDFGMARLASRDSKDTPLLGSPAYWCPEQIVGKPQDARSDIFSLGVVMYEMVPGHRPFDADSLQGICSRILSSPPLPPSHANPSVPAAFNELIASCLAKDPSQRCARQEAISSLKAAGTEGFACEGGSGVGDRIREQMPCKEWASNGRWPVTISYMTTPREKISERASCGLPSSFSGGQEAGAPSNGARV